MDKKQRKAGMDKKSKKLILIFLVALGVFSPLAGMALTPKKEPRPPFESPKKTQLFFSNPENDGGFAYVKESLKKVGPGDTIFADLFVMTDPEITRIIAERKKAGAHVSINLCQTLLRISQKSMNPLQKAEVNVNIFNPQGTARKSLTDPSKSLPQTLHKKTIGWTYTDPITGQIAYRLFYGSRNPTYMAQSSNDKFSNEELTVYEVNQESFAQAQATHAKIGLLCKEQQVSDDDEPTTPKKMLMDYSSKSPLKITPIKPMALETTETNICTSIAERIAKTTGEIYLSMYALNDPTVMRACLTTAQRKLFKMLLVDQVSLKKPEQLEFLQKLSSYGVAVYVFNPDKAKRCGRCPVQNHEKAFVRFQNDGSSLVGVGETNLTIANNNDICGWRLYPNNMEMAQELLQHFTDIAQEKFVPLQKAIEMINEKQTEKRKQPTQKKSTKIKKQKI